MQKDDKRLKRKVRNSYIISTVSIAMVLFLLGAVSFLILNALKASDRLKESISVYVMLRDDTTDEQLKTIEREIKSREEVKKTEFISKEQAAEDFKQYIGSDFEEFLSGNPLPDCFEVGLKAEGSDKRTVEEFEKYVAGLQGVDEVVYQKNIIEQIGTNLGKFNFVTLLFGAALFAISLILLNNTLRMTIVARRHLINTMKLVGATRSFIKRPFLASAAKHGIYAGLIASAMFLAMVAGLHEGLPEINLTGGSLNLYIVAGMIAGGVIISVVFTDLAVDKFIRMPTGKMYMY